MQKYAADCYKQQVRINSNGVEIVAEEPGRRNQFLSEFFPGTDNKRRREVRWATFQLNRATAKLLRDAIFFIQHGQRAAVLRAEVSDCFS